VQRASYDVQLHIGESTAPREYSEKWMPGLRLMAHPGMTTVM
jgi:hypothetical protein